MEFIFYDAKKTGLQIHQNLQMFTDYAWDSATTYLTKQRIRVLCGNGGWLQSLSSVFAILGA